MMLGLVIGLLTLGGAGGVAFGIAIGIAFALALGATSRNRGDEQEPDKTP